MIALGESIMTFCILFPTALGIAYVFFYTKKRIKVRINHKRKDRRLK